MSDTTRLKKAIAITENLAQKQIEVAHDYQHLDRVRNYARKIGLSEGLSPNDLLLLELAGLWHDIGLQFTKDRSHHSYQSAAVFQQTFSTLNLLTPAEIENVMFAVRYHDQPLDTQEVVGCTPKQYLYLRILIDSDTIDMLGFNGFLRAVMTVINSNSLDQVTLDKDQQKKLRRQLKKQISNLKMVFTTKAKDLAKTEADITQDLFNKLSNSSKL